MQKGKASPGLVRTQQQVSRGHTPPQAGDYNPRPGQGYPHQQIGQQGITVGPMANTGPPGQPRMPAAFFQPSRPVRMPRHPQPNPIYPSPPGGSPQMIQMVPQQGPFNYPPYVAAQVEQFAPHMQMPGGQVVSPFVPPQQYPPFTQPQQQPFPPPRYPQMARPPFFIMQAGVPPAQQQIPQPQRPTEPSKPARKRIQIRDPDSKRDITEEILSSRKQSGSFSGSTGSTPRTTPEVSAQSSNANTPPIQPTSSEDMRATFAAKVAATLEGNSAEAGSAMQQPEVPAETKEVPKEILRKPEEVQVTAPEVEVTPKLVGAVEMEPVQVSGDTTNAGETAPEQEDVTHPQLVDDKQDAVVEVQTVKEHATEVEEPDQSKPQEPDQSKPQEPDQSKPQEPDQSKPQEPVEVVETATSETDVKPEPVPEQIAPPVTSESPEVIVNGATGPQKTETNVSETKGDEEITVEQPTTPPQVLAETVKCDEVPAESPKVEVKGEVDNVPEDGPTPSSDDSAVGEGKVNGIETEAAITKDLSSKSATEAAVKDLPKKKKQKQRFRDIEKKSEKETDMMDAYTDKPPKEEVISTAEDEPADEQETVNDDTEEQPGSEEETWEEKEAAGKLTYDRDFLLQFQYNPVCKEKPQGLPDIEVVMKEPRGPPKASGGRLTIGGGGDFMPSYMQGGRSGQKPSQTNIGKGRRAAPKKVIQLAPKPEVQELKRSENAWVRPKEKSSDEDSRTAELYRKVRGILNKLTPQKFQTLTQQILDLEIETPERLEGVIDLIFEKAISEPGFSVAYGNMCRCLIPKKVVTEGKDGKEVTITFRKILLNKCQKEFEKEKKDEMAVHVKMDELTNQGLSAEELVVKKAELELEELKTKRRTLGNIRFIGELFKLKMLTEAIMHECVVKLLKSNDEESFECLCKLLFTIGKDLDHEKAKPRVDQYFQQIEKIIALKKTSSRVRFMLQDVRDLRKMKWVPRREDNNPKTIDQIHKEAADAAKKTQLLIQQSKQMQKRDRGDRGDRGMAGGRDSPRLVAQVDESWTTVGRGPRSVSVDPKKFQNIKRPAVDSESISLGPGGRGGFGAWARGSSGGSGPATAGAAAAANAGAPTAGGGEQEGGRLNRFSALAGETRRPSGPARQNSSGAGRQDMRSPVAGRRDFDNERERALEAVRAVSGQPSQQRSAPEEPKRASPTPAAPELSEEVVKTKTRAIIEEYLGINDMKEALLCVKELESPNVLYAFVASTFNITLEKREAHRLAAGSLLHALMGEGLLAVAQYIKGLRQVLENAEDMAIDIPLIYRYLGEVIGPSLRDGGLPLPQLNEAILQSISYKKSGAKLLAEVLLAAIKSTSETHVSELWSRARVSIAEYFSSAADAEEFAKDKKIEFTLKAAVAGKEDTSRQHSSQIQEELRDLILKRKARNEEVFNWIDRNVDKTMRMEPPFIRALVMCVCEDTLKREDSSKCSCDLVAFPERKCLLQVHLDGNASRQLQALYAVQELFVALEHPQAFLHSYFNAFHDEELISEEIFYAWEISKDEKEQRGRQIARQHLQGFYQWLRSASEESDGES